MTKPKARGSSMGGTSPEEREILFLCQDGKTPLISRRKPPKRPAVIHVDIWAKKTWTYHSEKKVVFKNLTEAREWASKQGFDGIRVENKNYK